MKRLINTEEDVLNRIKEYGTHCVACDIKGVHTNVHKSMTTNNYDGKGGGEINEVWYEACDLCFGSHLLIMWLWPQQYANDTQVLAKMITRFTWMILDATAVAIQGKEIE